MNNFNNNREIKPFDNKRNISKQSSFDTTISSNGNAFQKQEKTKLKIKNVTICLTAQHKKCTRKYANSTSNVIVICKCSCHFKENSLAYLELGVSKIEND
ncbi:MAG: hypothetical protein R3321_12835 [Nitrososphaeraceae archaeon]|nr:hypothetical protein [Nitrososphaeraceae archaeon]